MSTTFQDNLAQHLRTQWLGRELRWFASLDSTNTYLREHGPADMRMGLLVVADHQTAGRGRGDNRWLTPPGTALLWSLLLHAALDAPMAVCAASVAVARAVQAHTNQPVGIKWPNDVLAGEGKIAGLLAERTADGLLVLGCGINVHTPAKDLPPGATSLAALNASAPAREALLADVLNRLEPLLERLQAGEREAVMKPWREMSLTLGRRISVRLGAQELIGTAQSLTDDGSLVLRDDDGRQHTLRSGEVRHVRKGEWQP